MLKFTFNKTALDQVRAELKQALNDNTISFTEYGNEIKRLLRFTLVLSVDISDVDISESV